MVDAILAPALEKLGSLIADEGEFLSGVVNNVDWLRDELQSMRTFLQAAEEASSDNGQASLIPIDQIRDVIYDSEDIIDIFDLETPHQWVRLFACFFCYLNSRHRIGCKIMNIRSRLNDISRRRIQYKFDTTPHGDGSSNFDRMSNKYQLASSPLVHDGDLVGVEEDYELLLQWVLTQGGGADLSVISLVGMGGVGKTTIIKKVYNHGEVKRHFDRSAWIYVSQSIQLRDLLSEMAKGLMEIPPSEVDALSERQLQGMLLSSLNDRRYLLVFDDVWNKRFWDVIKFVLPSNKHGSRVIITTRNNEVASAVVDANIIVHPLRPLSFEESRELFYKKAFVARVNGQCRCPEELNEIAEGIVRKCGGLPLAIVTIGGMMSRKENILLEWGRVLENMYKDFQKNDDGVQLALYLSYKDLPYSLRSCFLFFSNFPQDSIISRERLIRLWVAEGFITGYRGELVEDVAEKYLMELINRNMIQCSMMSSSGRVKACGVHDLLHQLAIFISAKENFSIVCDDKKAEIGDKARRISYQKSFNNAASCKSKQQVRSLLLFGMTEPIQFSTNHLLTEFKLLRILDLEDANLNKLPSDVGDLIHLRYLSLKGTRIMKLPKSLKSLYKLQTLDVRRTYLQKLSFSLKSLKQLRHLEMKQVGESIKSPKGVSYLEKLQVLTGLQANGVVVHKIRNLTQLRKLGIKDLHSENAVSMCNSINNMACLSSLTILSDEKETQRLDLSSLIPPPSLHKLHLTGCLRRLPDWFGSIQGLTKLRLGLSQLSEDPFQVLEQLPALVFLQLYEAYEGKVIRCSNPGFKKLKILILTGMDELEEWEVEEGAMSCIQELWIMSCSKLKAIPLGFKFLTTLMKLRLVSMPEKFTRTVSSTSGGEDFIRVQHVPSIQVTT